MANILNNSFKGTCLLNNQGSIPSDSKKVLFQKYKKIDAIDEMTLKHHFV